VYFDGSGSWRQKQFKALNFDSCGKMPDGGHLHPLLKVRTQFRQIFLEMGLVVHWWLSFWWHGLC